MLNAEKHRFEIINVDYDFALYDDQRIDACDYAKCPDCKFYNEFTGCRAERIRWLLEDCEEPILNDEAKTYLKLILEPSKCTIIQKLVDGEEPPRKYKLLCSTDSGYIAILYKPGTKYYEYFKNMENDKAYTPEELDL